MLRFIQGLLIMEAPASPSSPPQGSVRWLRSRNKGRRRGKNPTHLFSFYHVKFCVPLFALETLSAFCALVSPPNT